MKLPLTREVFENVVGEVAKEFELPMIDDTRVAAINYFHSLDRFVYEFDPKELGAYLHKAYSSQLTFDIGQEIHKKRQAEAEEQKKLSVVPPQSTQ